MAGNDGRVKAAVVRTSTEHTMRPVVRMYPNEVNAQTKTDVVLYIKKGALVLADEKNHKWIHAQ